VACSATDQTRLVGAVDANAFFVERDPHHAHRIARPRRKQMKIPAPPTVLKQDGDNCKTKQKLHLQTNAPSLFRRLRQNSKAR
jgi:hypothetical protein